MGFKKLNSIALIVLMPTLFSLGCGQKQETTSSPSVDDPSDPTDPDDAPPNVVNNLGFYIKVDTDNKYLAYMTKGAAFNTDCSIATSAATSQDVSCLVDIQEGDLSFHPLKFNFNSPPNFCPYVRLTPYFYWNYEPGVGPSKVTFNILTTAGNSSVTSCAVTTEAGIVAGCTGHDEVEIDTRDSGDVTCKYDKTANKGPNCCFGSYEIERIITGDSPGVESDMGEWGGSYEACLGGPGIHSWPDKSSEGWPLNLLYYGAAGINEEWEIKSPTTNKFGTNYSVANYYGDLDHTHTGFVDLVTTSTLPYAYEPIDDRDGSYIPSTEPRLKLECLDTAFEVKHRIQVSVREWNTYSNFLAYATSNGTTSVNTANTGGVENGVACEYTFGGACNDKRDWDDLLNLLDGNEAVTTDLYDTTDVNLRPSYFPREKN